MAEKKRIKGKDGFIYTFDQDNKLELIEYLNPEKLPDGSEENIFLYVPSNEITIERTFPDGKKEWYDEDGNLLERFYPDGKGKGGVVWENKARITQAPLSGLFYS